MNFKSSLNALPSWLEIVPRDENLLDDPVRRHDPAALFAHLALIYGASVLVGIAAMISAIALTFAAGFSLQAGHFLIFPIIFIAISKSLA